MSNRSIRAVAVRIGWVVASLLVLVVSLYDADLPENRDNVLAMTYLMLLLSFPAGYLVALSYFGIAMLSQSQEFPPVSNLYAAFLLTWLGFFAAGYVQWFILLPTVVRGIRRWFERRRANAPPPRA